MKSYFGVLLATILFIVLTGCTSAPNLPDESQAAESQVTSVLVSSYKMAVGDVVQINVWKNPELSLSAPIRPDGKISMPLIGSQMAAGRTPEELAADIEAQLSTYIKRPKVTVILTSLEGHQFLSRIRVTGAVGENLSLNYHPGMTVLDAVLEAGGVDAFADGNRTKLHRRMEGGTEAYDIRLRDIIEDGDMTTNLYLVPGDVITVPERRF